MTIKIAVIGFGNIAKAIITPLLDKRLINPEDVKKKISSKTKAIMPVHMYGNMCDMNRIMAIAKESNLFVVEDCVVVQCLCCVVLC